MPEELASFLEVIEGGQQVTGEVVQFGTDMAGAGAALEGIESEVVAANGAATTVSQLTVVEGGATTTAGVGLLGLELPAAAAAAAPALGLLAGIGLYKLSPSFWTSISNRLMEAGETIGGKVRGFVNAAGQFGLSETALNIFKNAFIENELYEGSAIYPDNETLPPSSTLTITSTSGATPLELLELGIHSVMKRAVYYDSSYDSAVRDLETWTAQREGHCFYISFAYANDATTNFKGFDVITIIDIGSVGDVLTINSQGITTDRHSFFCIGVDGSIPGVYNIGYNHGTFSFTTNIRLGKGYYNNNRDWYCNTTNATPQTSPYIDPTATLPDINLDISISYPSWEPWDLPIELPKIFPLEIPELNPNANQQESQNPDPVPDDAKGILLNWLLDNLNLPNLIVNPQLNPDPIPDPDPQPEDPDPVPEKAIETHDPDPIPPDPIPPDPPIPPFVPIVPDSVESNAMFTVYRPSLQQINSFGSWLWTSSIIEQIARLWQDPMDGIISLMKVYANPVVGASQNIIVGFLDSGVSAPVVTSQFVTVDCGSINISEYLKNATDYPPYTQLEVYLPFIGIVEVDVTDFMAGSMSIEYGIDIYTGTCLATIKATRAKDMPTATALYTFSGNASQQLPLSNVSFAGAIQTLVGAVGGGLAIASGGALAGVAGMAALGSSLTHEMIHVSHGGSLSANAGIMGSRVPYAIISRQHSYDASWYNQIYGYPANKTVYIGNCSGYIRIKKCLIHSSATEAEIEEMYNLLENGVIA